MELAHISLIEEVAANALPPGILQLVDGWRLRYNFGVTRRANSVLANDQLGRLSLVEKLELTADFYTRLGVPARFQVCPSSQPPELDAMLEARGYRLEPGALVQTATVSRGAACLL